MSRGSAYLFVILLAIPLSALEVSCAKKSQDTSAVQGVSVTAVDLGRSVGGDKRVTEKATDFKPNDVIYASVLTSGSASSAVVRAKWTYEDGQVVNESEQTIAPTGDSATEFHISKPNGWPVGKYKLEVFLDGNPVQSRDFEVKAG
jgi:hypothetical protein